MNKYIYYIHLYSILVLLLYIFILGLFIIIYVLIHQDPAEFTDGSNEDTLKKELVTEIKVQ